MVCDSEIPYRPVNSYYSGVDFIMAYRLKPGQPISQSVRQVGVDQIERVLTQFSAKGKMGSAVHEARKSMKRLRALLHLIRPAMMKGEFRRDEARLKMIARSLSGARDAQAMIEAIEKLDHQEGAEAFAPLSKSLRAILEERRKAAEAGLTRSGTAQLRKQLKEARDAFTQISLEPDAFSIVAETLENDYRKARKAFASAYKLDEDEEYHEWRKQVQRHWRQLLLIAPSWPKAIRPHIALARELSEILGDDHDLSVLAALVSSEREALGVADEADAYIAFCRERQRALRETARELGARLLAEKPRSFARRISVYWEMGRKSDAEGDEAISEDTGNIIALTR
jgi:CHAD domain-containing protein